MSLPVIADTFRLALTWSNGGTGVPATSTNVVHIRAATHSATEVADIFQNLLAVEATDALSCLSSEFTLTNIQSTALDGSSAGLDVGYSSPSGQASGDFIPQGCMVVTLRTAQKGSQGRGRIYVGPVAESKQSNGGITSGADPTGGWQAIKDGLVLDSCELVVASYLHSAARTVESISIHPFLRTQRRRARH